MLKDSLHRLKSRLDDLRSEKKKIEQALKSLDSGSYAAGRARIAISQLDTDISGIESTLPSEALKKSKPKKSVSKPKAAKTEEG